MYITSSQKYQITCAVNHKSNKVAARISRVFKMDSANSIRKMIKQRISRELKSQFEFRAIEQLQEANFEQYMEALNKYEYFYRCQLFK